MPQEQGAADGQDQPEDEKERSCGDKARDCGIQFMDCLAVVGRGTVTAGRSCGSATSHAVYPVKERVVKTKDACMLYFHPWEQKAPVGPEVANFRMGADDAKGLQG
uniref:Uncharacterized protein n=1 Tax=Alexandrium catenella TaxID=2925 RepID=A0A7S1LJH1_ALECA|mmetsp:Transcript_11506/g.31363  ORF Transcript_11506/g.31363 Transcript_11506/m.31363 type:complete len:106 (+) Transcript_11506:87-404(+)